MKNIIEELKKKRRQEECEIFLKSINKNYNMERIVDFVDNIVNQLDDNEMELLADSYQLVHGDGLYYNSTGYTFDTVVDFSHFVDIKLLINFKKALLNGDFIHLVDDELTSNYNKDLRYGQIIFNKKPLEEIDFDKFINGGPIIYVKRNDDVTDISNLVYEYFYFLSSNTTSPEDVRPQKIEQVNEFIATLAKMTLIDYYGEMNLYDLNLVALSDIYEQIEIVNKQLRPLCKYVDMVKDGASSEEIGLSFKHDELKMVKRIIDERREPFSYEKFNGVFKSLNLIEKEDSVEMLKIVYECCCNDDFVGLEKVMNYAVMDKKRVVDRIKSLISKGSIIKRDVKDRVEVLEKKI